MAFNRIMVWAGVFTLLQATVQLTFMAVAVAQYFCLIDFLRGLPLLLYLRILYFHYPDNCGVRINIGQSIDGIADQAFVLLTQEPFTAFRTFIINCVALGLSVFWIIASLIIITGGARNKQSKVRRWPWIIVTVAVCGVDLVAAVIYANDSFHTRTLNEVMDFIGGVASGTANVQLNTSWAAWVMVLIYSKGVVFFLLNVLLIVLVIVDYNRKYEDDLSIERVESPTQAPTPAPLGPPPAPVVVPPPPVEEPPPALVETQSTAVQAPTPTLVAVSEGTEERDEEVASLPSESRVTTRIPRAEFRRSFSRMKAFLFKKSPTPEVRSNPESVDASPERSPHMQARDADKKRTVNFPESMMSLPQRLENIIAEQRRRLDAAVIDTAGRRSPPRASQSLPQLSTTQADGARGMNEPSVSVQDFFGLNGSLECPLRKGGLSKQCPPRTSGLSKRYDEQSALLSGIPTRYLRKQGGNLLRGRRGTTAELQGQLPWAYIPASAHRMRDQLPPDEDLPPVPLPDYTAFPSGRKASVHRAASSLSSLTQKRDYVIGQSTRLTLNQADVLY